MRCCGHIEDRDTFKIGCFAYLLEVPLHELPGLAGIGPQLGPGEGGGESTPAAAAVKNCN